MKKAGFVIWFVFFVIQSNLFAQSWQAKVSKSLFISSDSFLLDTSVILKGSVLAENYIEGIDYRINYLHKAFINKRIPQFTKINVSYLITNYNFSKVAKRRELSQIQPELKADRNPFSLQTIEPEYALFLGSDGLQSSGSIMRGLSVGNNTNSIVNSNLNLQLAGKINNDIDVLAAISDDNNPIQPEGNTQDLQDFDQVYVQFSKNKNQLVVGDFLMNKPANSYFMNYYKKSRGLHVASDVKLKNGILLQNQIEAAISRGRFVRNTFNGTEGNQGPYRLTGSNGELFIIIISGTESVYLDGEKLNRGEQNDYVIDYNTGEITFMPKRLISSFSRIVVEFQYSDRNYARTVLTAMSSVQKKQSNYYIQIYSEQDNKNQPFQQSLSDSNKALLASIGNETDLAVVSGESAKRGFASGKILYRKIDTLAFSQIFIYSPTQGEDSNYYEVKFSYVGNSKGNYVQSASAANGRVFKWVEPINGIPQGDFEPIIKLIAPNKRQMLSAGYIFDNKKSKFLQLEFAGSNDDKNTFSTLGNSDNLGLALRLNARLNNLDKNRSYKTEHSVFYEFTSLRFKPIERYRNVEFDRIWQRQLNNQSATSNQFSEQIAQYRFDLSNKLKQKVYYQLGFYNKGESLFTGIQQQAGFQVSLFKFQIISDVELLNAKQNEMSNQKGFNNDLKSAYVAVSRNFSKISNGFNFRTESSLFKSNSDSLYANSFSYLKFGYYLKSLDTFRLNWNLNIDRRIDELPVNKQMIRSSSADEIKGTIVFNAKNSNRWRLDVSYRNFQLEQASSINQKNEETFLGRIEYDYGFFKRKIIANTYLQTGSGSELRRDFQYLEVPTGQGVYVWKDFNTDGIQQLNEFVPAALADKNLANYIKVFLPSSSLIGTFSNQFNQTLNISSFALNNRNSGLNAWFKKFSNQTGWRYEQKKLKSDLDILSGIMPISQNDSGLISMNSLLRNTLFFNRSNPVFGFDYTYQSSQGRVLQTNGNEIRSKYEHGLTFRWSFSSSWSVQTALNAGERNYYSGFFTDNSYAYLYNEIKPKLQYQYRQFFRASLNYSYFDANNNYESNKDAAKVQELGAELRFSISKLGVIQLKYSFYQIDYLGNAGSNLAYEMLQGLSNGNNQIWNLNIQQRLGQNLQINFNYDGRISGSSDVIHIGRMEARYLF